MKKEGRGPSVYDESDERRVEFKMITQYLESDEEQLYRMILGITGGLP